MIDDAPQDCEIRAWAPDVAGVAEVFHAKIVDYAYPAHCHDTWTVLIVDAGAIQYDLDKKARGASGQTVAILPPGVVHDGQPASGAAGFNKRVLYLEPTFLPMDLVGAAVDRSNLADSTLRTAIDGLHTSLIHNEDPIDGQTRLSLIQERIEALISKRPKEQPRPEPTIAYRFRELLDEHVTTGICLDEAAKRLQCSTAHLSRSFSATFGVSPHAYITGRRIDRARPLLLAGVAPAVVATEVGFYDQAHFTRHFKRHTSTTPGRFPAHRGV